MKNYLKIYLSVIFTVFVLGAGNNIFGQVVFQKADTAQGSSIATQAGLFSKFVYFQRSAGVNVASLKPMPAFFIGPGAFFDFRLNPDLALSGEVSILFDVAGTMDRASSFQGGAFAKYWVSDMWGFVGIGSEVFINTLVIGGVTVKETDVMLSFILTGESIPLKGRFYSTGHLRGGISVYNSLKDPNVRFYLAYTLGLSFHLTKK